MEDRIGLVAALTLVIAARDDSHAVPAAPRVAAAISGAGVVTIEGAPCLRRMQCPRRSAR